MTNDLGTFTISAEWMTACGYGTQAMTYPVSKITEYPQAGPGFQRFFTVEMWPGKTWIVAEYRGTYLPAVNDLTVPGGCGAAVNPIRFKKFFSIDDGKAVKAQKNAKGWLNAINYMAPHDSAGVGNLCPHASAGCRALCLGTESGQAAMRREGEDNAVTLSRKAKAAYFMRDRQAFLGEARVHIGRALDRAREARQRLCVRMNGSTDIAWERSGLMDKFPTVQFTDYTKSFARMMRFCAGGMPANYHLTFSRAEDNEAQCLAVLSEGGNVAVVSSGERPATWHGFNTLDGDKHDLRHLDGRGEVVWLSPKGNKAKRDASGFVLRAA